MIRFRLMAHLGGRRLDARNAGRVFAGAVLSVVSLAGAPAAQDQEFPVRPIQLIVPYGPGGPTDSIARALAGPLGQRLGQAVVVVNKPGASGAIGANMVAKAAPDGYTILLSNNGDAVTVAVGVKANYAYEQDLAPLSLLGTTPFVVVVNPKTPVTSVKSLIQYLKSNSSRVTYGTSGTGSVTHVATEQFLSLIGAKATHVPYKGQAEASMGLMGGQFTFMFANPVNALPQINAGTLRALAVTGAQRDPALPQVPTVGEDGVPGYEFSAWFGLMAPAHTPDAIVARLSREIAAVVEQPQVRAQFGSFGVQARASTAPQFSALIKDEIERWTKVVKDADIHVN